MPEHKMANLMHSLMMTVTNNPVVMIHDLYMLLEKTPVLMVITVLLIKLVMQEKGVSHLTHLDLVLKNMIGMFRPT